MELIYIGNIAYILIVDTQNSREVHTKIWDGLILWKSIGMDMKTWKAFEEKYLNIVVNILYTNHWYASSDRKTNHIVIYFTKSAFVSSFVCCLLCPVLVSPLQEIHQQPWTTSLSNIIEGPWKLSWNTRKTESVKGKKDSTLIMVRYGDMFPKVVVNLQPW